MKRLCLVLMLVFLAGLSAFPAGADVLLTSQNSTANILGDGSGLNSWTVDSTSQLFYQAFFYRVGSSGGESNLSTVFSGITNTANTAAVNYTGSGFTATVLYSLHGGATGSGTSDLGIQIGITNTGTTDLNFHFFQYADFDLGANPGGNVGTHVNANNITQTGGGIVVGETVFAPTPALWEIGAYPTIINALLDGNPTTLTNGVSGFTGDVSWALEWDFTLGAGQTFLISKDELLTPVPIPPSVLLLGSGLLGLVGLRRFRKS